MPWLLLFLLCLMGIMGFVGFLIRRRILRQRKRREDERREAIRVSRIRTLESLVLLSGGEDNLAVLEELIPLVPHKGEHWQSLGNAYNAHHRYEDAIAAFDQAISLGVPRNREHINVAKKGKGDAYLHLDRPKEAKEAYRSAYGAANRLDDEMMVTEWYYAAYRDMQRYQDALDVLNTVLRTPEPAMHRCMLHKIRGVGGTRLP